MKYKDIDKRKSAFILELDDVLYPEKDYLFQVYYLFSNFLEYTELLDAKQTTEFMTATYIAEGADAVFERVVDKFALAGKYRNGFNDLLATAKLPLKLLLYQNMLSFLQDVVVDRKKLFIVTNGPLKQQVNKIKQIEWHGLEKYLTCYFTEETTPKPEPDVVHILMQEHHLERRHIIMIENSKTDRLCAEAVGIDYVGVNNFL